MELEKLSDSFAALARMYARHHRQQNEEAPKLYVTRVDTGSVILEIAPLAVVMGGLVLADNAIIAADFANRLWRGIRAFSALKENKTPSELPSKEDAADIREFTKPLVGRKGAGLGIKHARYEKDDGATKTIVEYSFDENDLNRAALNIDEALALPAPNDEEASLHHGVHSEVMLFFEQANRGPGKEKGRTGDRGVVPDISPRAFPVYFRKSIGDLKEKMALGEFNPLTSTYIVDVHAQSVDGEIKGYIVTDVHNVIPSDDD